MLLVFLSPPLAKAMLAVGFSVLAFLSRSQAELSESSKDTALVTPLIDSTISALSDQDINAYPFFLSSQLSELTPTTTSPPSLEAAIIIKLNQEKLQIVEGIDLSELCITSSAEIQKNETEDILVETNKAEGEKCSVCWKITKGPCERHKI